MAQQSYGEIVLNREYTSLIGYFFDSITHLKSATVASSSMWWCDCTTKQLLAANRENRESTRDS